MHKLKSRPLVHQAVVSIKAVLDRHEEAKGTEPVVDRYDEDVLLGEL